MRAVPDWSFMRSVLEQGASIQQDYYAGRHPTYEHYSARIDEAAREREAQIAAAPAPVDGLVDEVRHALERVRHELYKPARILFTKDMVLVETQLTAKTADEPLGCGLVAITLNEESAAMVREAAAALQSRDEGEQAAWLMEWHTGDGLYRCKLDFTLESAESLEPFQPTMTPLYAHPPIPDSLPDEPTEEMLRLGSLALQEIERRLGTNGTTTLGAARAAYKAMIYALRARGRG